MGGCVLLAVRDGQVCRCDSILVLGIDVIEAFVDHPLKCLGIGTAHSKVQGIALIVVEIGDLGAWCAHSYPTSVSNEESSEEVQLYRRAQRTMSQTLFGTFDLASGNGSHQRCHALAISNSNGSWLFVQQEFEAFQRAFGACIM